ncbi:hypothetical protein ACO22_02668 [Paracoccidioides brasiliensis]|uniref:Ubiquitin-like protease family profile domain-containing protein n=1 Tax=Paracoccidioides brasiliensis TaxID=121759 RepID=A0A1D2JI39_PARBR|nr:hypothetical protein ACO22_02668 [Paracoccidioides brasiliensis]
MKWLSKLIHVGRPNHTLPNPAEAGPNPDFSRRRRRDRAYDFEDIIVPAQMSGVSDELSPARGQMSNTFQFAQLGKSSTGIPRATSSQRENSQLTPRKITSQSEEELQEERRLFGGSRKDPNAVRIIPGTLPRKGGSASNLKALENFSPRNTLSSNSARTPVQTFGERHPERLIRPLSYIQDVVAVTQDEEKGNHPRKRQKTDDSPASADVIEVNDDESVIRVEPPFSARSRNFGQRYSSKTRSISQQDCTTPEFWNVEGRVQDFKDKTLRAPDLTEDERFTMEAKAQRFGKKTSPHFARTVGSHLLSPTEQMLTVELSPLDKLDGAGPMQAETMGSAEILENSFVQTDGQLQFSDILDSPDEIQGEKTIRETWRSNFEGHQNRMPGDINPTNFSRAKRDRKHAVHRIRLSNHTRSFSVRSFDDRMQTVEGKCTLIVNTRASTFTIRNDDDDDSSQSREFNILKINQVLYGGPRAAVKFPLSSGARDDINIRFSTEKECWDYCILMGELNSSSKLTEKTSPWMTNAFNRDAHLGRRNRQRSRSRRKSPQDGQTDTPTQPSKPTRRQKISETLLGGDGTIGNYSRDTTPHFRGPCKNGHVFSPSRNHSQPDIDDPAAIPIKTYKPSVCLRVTRSRAHQQPSFTDSDHEPSPSPLRNTCKWTKPLVYPPQGKKKAEVEFHDLERLGDGEFLNDNLIGIYLRFLEHHMERNRPDLAKRIYFFNTYFFASLTNTPRGRRGINYQAVEKWTRSVDIFNYDYIIVPINESAHWFLAIICNLPSLCRTECKNENIIDGPAQIQESGGLRNREGGGKVKVEPQTGADTTIGVQTAQNGKDQILRKRFFSMSLSDKVPKTEVRQNETSRLKERESPDINDWPDEEENGPSLPMVQPEDEENILQQYDRPKQLQSGKSRDLGPPRKKSARKSQFDSKQPIIITFDSLGCQRSPTARILRQYLEEEGKAKKSLTIDPKKILSMTAQQIPHQPNFSDCGLYLLAYLEKFMHDPDELIRKLVNREMSEQNDWPLMKSRVLRRRLRNFLLALYDEAEGVAQEGSKLVNVKPLKILLGDSVHSPKASPAKSSEWRGKQHGYEECPSPEATPNTEEKKKTAHSAEKEPQQATPTRFSLLPRQNDQQRTTKTTRAIGDDAAQQYTAQAMPLGISAYGCQNAAIEDPPVEVPRTPSPDIVGMRVSRLSTRKSSPTTRSQGLPSQNQEILDGI